jgi:hypothetical protein
MLSIKIWFNTHKLIKLSDSHERIDAAINFYKAKGIDNIVLIAHGCGAHMSMSYLDKYGAILSIPFAL